MRQLTVRNIDDTIYQRLKDRARVNHRSLEAEVRVILDQAVVPDRSEVARRAAAMRARLRGRYTGNATAALLLAPEYEMVAPDLFSLEVGNILLKALGRNEITVADGIEALGALLPGAVRTVRSADHAEAAFDTARRFGGSVYDAVYVSVARELGSPIVTDDARLAAVAGKMGVDASMIAEGAPALPDSTA